MKIAIANINNIVDANDLKEVTSPIIMKGTIPNDEGLFSKTIFGDYGSIERKEKFSYVNLGKTFIHPKVYILIKKIYRKIDKIVSGAIYVKITKLGILEDSTDDDPDAWTGINNFIKNYNKIKFDVSISDTKKDKVEKLRRYKKEEIFISKWLIIPPHYRDIQIKNGMSSIEEISEMYKKLVASTRIYQTDIEFGTLYRTDFSVQNQLIEIHNYFIKGNIGRKHGLLKDGLLGKAIDYSTRAVLTAPKFRAESWKDVNIDFYHVGLPLHLAIIGFLPFVVKGFLNFIYTVIQRGYFIYHDIINDKITKIKKSVEKELTEDFVIKLIKKYIKTYELRDMEISLMDENEKPVLLFSNLIKRNITLLDLFYVVTYDVVKHKHVLVTRYPLEDYRNIVPFKIVLLTTRKTIPKLRDDRWGIRLTNYPIIEDGVKTQYDDSLKVHSAYLEGYGGDFDGDMVTVKSVWTLEANEECDNYLNNGLLNVLTGDGSFSRNFGKEAILTYNFSTHNI